MFRSLAPIIATVAALLVSGCATVSTQVVRFEPAVQFAPTQSVEILLEKPQRPYREIALLESRGMVGDSEIALWQDAREKAQVLGADALIRLEVDKTVQLPVVLYDPFFSPFYSPYYPHRYFFPPYFTEYRVIPGGPAYTLKTVAIKYGMTSGKQDRNKE
jgi:hypothetical protein